MSGSGVAAVDERLLVALACVNGIHDLLDDPADQVRVIDDVVRQWHALPQTERELFEAMGDERFGPLMQYTWTYIERIEQEAVSGLPADATETECERACLLYWREYVARLADLQTR